MMNRTHFKQVSRVDTRNSRRRGSILLEAVFAVLFLLVPLVLGIIQFGIYYGATNVLSQVSREGGRYAAVYGTSTAMTGAQVDDFIKTYMVQVGQNGNVTISKSNITISPAYAARARYSPITVTVSYNLGAPLASGGKRLIPLFNPGTVTRSYTAMSE